MKVSHGFCFCIASTSRRHHPGALTKYLFDTFRIRCYAALSFYNIFYSWNTQYTSFEFFFPSLGIMLCMYCKPTLCFWHTNTLAGSVTFFFLLVFFVHAYICIFCVYNLWYRLRISDLVGIRGGKTRFLLFGRITKKRSTGGHSLRHFFFYVNSILKMFTFCKRFFFLMYIVICVIYLYCLFNFYSVNFQKYSLYCFKTMLKEVNMYTYLIVQKIWYILDTSESKSIILNSVKLNKTHSGTLSFHDEL